MEPIVFNFELTEEEAQKIYESLMQEPYKEVVDLINKLNSQAHRQRNS